MTPYYQEKGITIYHGDCRDVLPTLEPVDLVLTDPIYGVSQVGVRHEGQPGRGSRNFDFFANDSSETARALVLEAAALTLPLMKEHASAYWWVGHRQFGPLTDFYDECGYVTRFLGWRKQCPAPPPPGSGWPSALELCIYAFRPGRRWTHNGVDFPKSNVLDADSYRHGMPGKVNHPTQKPLRVFAPLIKASSFEGDCVLDPFMGSGTTLRAAKDLGRQAIGIEIEERYCEIAARRLSQEVLSFEPVEIGLTLSSQPG